MFGESKYDVLSRIPTDLIPRTILVTPPFSEQKVLELIGQHGFQFPLIFKPDLGERGFMVQRIFTSSDVSKYISVMKHSFIIQELVDLPLEFGVFYSRLPEQENGTVTSVVMKEMLSVEGDGKSTLQELILRKDRAKLQWKSLQLKFYDQLNTLVPDGKKIEIVSIGNHCLGTKFINANYLINDKLSASFDKISKQIDGFYFGRFDLRCASIHDLYEGKIKVVELNGCGAEPAHIYDPGFSFFKAMGVLIQHWRTIYRISSQNKNRGIQYITLRDAIAHYRNFKVKVSQ